VGSPERPGYLFDLAGAWWEYYGRSGQKAVLDRVIGLSEELLAQTPPDSSNRATVAYNLGLQLLQRDHPHSDGVDLQRAIEAFDDVLAQTRRIPPRWRPAWSSPVTRCCAGFPATRTKPTSSA
jgi:hypothetical protein